MGERPRTGGELERIEIDLLLEGVYRHYGFDFRGYSLGSLRRRLARRMQEERAATLSGLQEIVLHDPDAMQRLLVTLSINVTSMFRDPGFYLAIREKVVPLLRTYPFVRFWNAGCSTGEETYSLAILLAEEGLYERSRIYATDFNGMVVETAKTGRFPLAKMREFTENYLRAGGAEEFSRYYAVHGDRVVFSRALVDNVVFAQHNLASDQSFNEFNLILCRNVLIYFGRPLQERVHGLLYDSLAHLGVLGLGQKETLRFTPLEDRYEPLDAREKLYRRVR